MTRQEFVEEILEMWQLKTFCYDYGFDDELSDVYDQDAYRDWVWDAIQNWSDDWESLASWLYNLPETSDYDYFDLSDEPCGVGDYEFDYYKERVLETVDSEGDFWDDTDEFEIEEAPEEPPKPDDTEFMLLIAS